MSKFKIGDKVRVTKQHPFFEAVARVGDVGIITDIINPNQGSYYIDFKGHGQWSGMELDNIELTNEGSASKQEDLQSEKQAEKVATKRIGELTVGLNVDLVSDLKTIISDYMYLLDSIKDPFARGVIKSQITDLTDLQYNQLKGNTDA